MSAAFAAARRWTLSCAGIIALLGAAPAVATRNAHAARTVQLDETAHLHLTSRRGPHLNEEGTANGTIHGPIYIHIVQSARSSAAVSLNVYPHGSSLSGSGSAAYRIAGGYAKFSGTVSITHGTGRYARAHAQNLRFTGAIQVSTEAIDVRLSGTLQY